MIVDLLNKHLPKEISAHVRYNGHAQLLKFHGYSKLAKRYKAAAKEELGHANRVILRIRQLDGMPDYIPELISAPLKKCDVALMLKQDLAVEELVLESLTNIISIAEDKETDFETSNVLRELVTATEEDIQYYTTQLDLIEDLGLQNYLQAQL